MGTILRALGSAEETSIYNIEKEYSEFLIENEKVIKVYKTIRDKILFTDRRIIFENVQGIGLKVSLYSLPYKNISSFYKESAGLLDLNAELVIFVKGEVNPHRFTFDPNANINEAYMLISKYILLDESYDRYLEKERLQKEKEVHEKEEKERLEDEQKKEESKKRIIDAVGKVENLEQLLSDPKIKEEAEILKRMYGTSAYENYLKNKAKELGFSN